MPPSGSNPPDGPAPRQLPAHPSQENLRKQAKRCAKLHAIPLAQAQQRLAMDYGCAHWGQLMELVMAIRGSSDAPPMSSSGEPNQPLQAAARKKDLDAVRQLLLAGQYNQEQLDAGLAGALWYGDEATQWPRMQAIADLLLEYGADVDGRINTYGPIVFGAGECNMPQSLQYLIDNGADVTFGLIDTKYGRQCPLSYWLGSYGRGNNARKHQGIDILLKHNAFIPPEVTPAMLAIHRGDAPLLAQLLEKDPALVHQRFTEMPYGNILLHGATLLHCAAEFDEIPCIQVLLDHGADINTPADVIDGIGGQTPLFHVVNTHWGSHLATLEAIGQRVGMEIDFSLRATWRTVDGPRGEPVTLLEYVHEGNPKADHRKNQAAELMLLESQRRPVLQDPAFKAAVKAVQAGDLAGLQQLLTQHPNLVHDRAIEPAYYSESYFRDPKLLWFVANNPNLIQTMPRNTVQLADAIIRAGAQQADLDYTLELVMTSRPAREQYLQRPLIQLLLAHHAHASPQSLWMALGHGERDAVATLLEAGLPLSAPLAAGLGMTEALTALLPGGVAQELHAAFSLAVINREVEAVRLCLDAGANVNQPLLVHRHSCALHQAAVNDDVPMLRLLVERGAQLDTRDTLWNGTPLGWAIHGHNAAAEAYLRSVTS